MDVFEMQKAAKRALDYIRAGNGPYILEVLTYRYRGHSMSDPAKYRTKEEVTDMKDNRDPIVKVRNLMLEHGMNEDEIKVIDKEIKEIIAEAAQFAQDSPEPPPEDLWTDVLLEVGS